MSNLRTMSIESLSSAEKTELLCQLVEDKVEKLLNFTLNTEDNKEVFVSHEREITDYADSVRIIYREVKNLKLDYKQADELVGNYIEPEQIQERHQDDADLS
jgi:hypothetical protein